MSKLTSFLVKMKPTFYSIRHSETFQVAKSLIIPQPTTLIGALAYTYAITNNVGRLEALNTITANTVIARAKLLSPAVVESVILRRLRILDKGMERKGKKGRAEAGYSKLLRLLSRSAFPEFIKTLTTLTDAMYREYIHSHEVLALYILKSHINVKPELITRIGDTESLCTIIDVQKVNVRKLEVRKVTTSYPFPLTDDVKDIYGSYIIVKMCSERDIDWSTGLCRPCYFVIPAHLEFKRARKGYRIPIYRSSHVTVEFSKDKVVFEVNKEYVIP